MAGSVEYAGVADSPFPDGVRLRGTIAVQTDKQTGSEAEQHSAASGAGHPANQHSYKTAGKRAGGDWPACRRTQHIGFYIADGSNAHIFSMTRNGKAHFATPDRIAAVPSLGEHQYTKHTNKEEKMYGIVD